MFNIAKKYIMLVNGIVGMGGGQMYTNNKLEYMQKLGWQTYVFSGNVGHIIIEGLKKYKRFIIKTLVSAPLIYPTKVVNRIIDYIIEQIGTFDEAIIESCSGQMALWGELLAKRLNCKNMVHLLDERNDLTIPEGYLDYYRFKLNRKELSGINSNSLKMLFRNSQEITDDNSYHLPSVCQNVVANIDIPVDINIPQNSITLGCIGRFEKAYVIIAAKSFLKVIKKHPKDSFNVLFIGDSEEKYYKEYIRDLFAGIDNVSLIMPGFLYPIPKKIFDVVDVFVCSAGSANLSYRNNRPTISVDANDNMAIGILGYTTTNSLYRESEEMQNVSWLLEEVLFNNYLNGRTYKPKETIVRIDDLEKHIDFFKNSSPIRRYYHVEDMRPSGKDKKKRIVRLILGTSGYVKFHDLGLRYVRRMKIKR